MSRLTRIFTASCLMSALTACAAGDPSDLTLGIREEPLVSGSDCNPDNAAGAVPAPHRAMLDTIASAEGTAGAGKDGYNVAFGFHYFSSCDQHPRVAYPFSGGKS